MKREKYKGNQYNRIYTEEKCREIIVSKGYKTWKELRNDDESLYCSIRRYKYDFSDLLGKSQNIYTKKIDYIYAYEFVELKSVYIGRTVNPKQRDCGHRNTGTVYKFAISNNVPIPQMTILKSDLILKEGLEWEDYYVKKYKEEGWDILNKAKTGVVSGSLGLLDRGKWTEKTVYEEARKFDYLIDFIKESPSAYNKALENGWLANYDWLKRDEREKSVVQLTLDNQIVAVYPSIRSACREIGYKGNNNLSACCRGVRHHKTAKGFKWMFLDDYLADWWDTQMDIAA